LASHPGASNQALWELRELSVSEATQGCMGHKDLLGREERGPRKRAA